MSWKEKVVEALRGGLVLNERVQELGRKIERLDRDVRDIDRRLVRLETFVEIAEINQKRLSKQ